MSSAVADAVDFENLNQSYDGRRALDGLTFRAPTGAITCVLGPNGAGKTTAVEMAVGLRRPDSGTVRVLGVDPWRAGAEHRRDVGVMLQDGGLPGSVKPLRFLRHVATMVGGLEELPRLVESLAIDQFRPGTIRRLSGGQRQRVALAAALVARPRVAFLDEPSAGLDPHARHDMWDLLGSYRDHGTALVVTTHSFAEAERLADRIVVISEGKVVAEGTPDTIVDGDLEHTYFELTKHTRKFSG